MIRRFLTHHPLMKLFSLILATMLWYVIHNEKHLEMDVNIPVRYLNIPTGMVITGDVPDMIKLKLRGSKLKMSNLEDEFFSPYQINLKDAVGGQNVYKIFPDDFQVPFGVIIDRIQPEVIHINLDKTAIKAVPVLANIVGTPAPGFEFKSKTTTPSEVQVRSYPSMLKLVDSLPTEEINLDGRTRSFEGNFNVDTVGFKVTLLNQTVHVAVEIVEKEGTETILSVPVRWDEQDDILIRKSKAHFQPDAVSIKITGPLSKVFEYLKNPPAPILKKKVLMNALKQHREDMIPVEVGAVTSMKFEVEPTTVKLVYGHKQ